MDIKEQVIQAYLSGKGSYRQLSAKYGMSRDVINKWVLIHQGIHNLPPTEQQSKYALSSMNSSQDKSTKEDLSSVKELEQKIAILQKQLDWGRRPDPSPASRFPGPPGPA